MLVLLAEIGSGASAAFMIGNVIVPSFLLEASDTQLASQLLEQLVTGEVLIGFAGYEPGSGYGLRAPATSACKVGDGWRLTGTKTRVVSGLPPRAVIVSATVGEAGDVALFLVELDAPGVSCAASTLVDGTPVLDIRFVDVALVPEMSLLLAGGAGDAIEDCMYLASFCACAAALGCMKRALALTADYLKLREQFGRSLSTFQALQHRVADMVIAMDDAHSSLFQAMAAMAGAPAVRRRAIAGCVVKVMAATKWVTGEAVHLHGGIGFTSEHEIGHLYQTGVVYGRLFGDADHYFARYVALATE